MILVQITPGAGAMYCGNCLRDNALVAALRRLGHEVLMLPVYLPLTLDEEDQSASAPVFFGGISVYLEQKSALFRHAPDWFRRLLESRRLLKWAAGKAAKTRAADLGDLTLSVLRGEEGNQKRDLEQLIAWLKTQPKPDAIILSNALLIGMVHRLKSELRAPVVCTLQGEDTFLDGLPEVSRAACWRELAGRAKEADLFIAPSRYFADVMTRRLKLPASKVRVVYNGISLAGYADTVGWPGQSPREDLLRVLGKRVTEGSELNVLFQRAALLHLLRNRMTTSASSPVTRHPSPVLGFFARMCKEKGLDTLVSAYIILRQRPALRNLRLKVGGSCGPADEPLVKSLRERLAREKLSADVEFHPNLSRQAKLDFLRSLTIFSVPALYGEAFGLYLIEALAAGVPVVQPRTAAFPELIEATGGGVLCQPGDPKALADGMEQLLLEPPRVAALGQAGRRAVFERFNDAVMAQEMIRVLDSVVRVQGPGGRGV